MLYAIVEWKEYVDYTKAAVKITGLVLHYEIEGLIGRALVMRHDTKQIEMITVTQLTVKGFRQAMEMINDAP